MKMKSRRKSRNSMFLFGICSIILMVLLLTAPEASADTLMPLPPFDHTFSNSGLSRGYWFEAPTFFVITGLRVPDEIGDGIQNVEVVRFNNQIPPPLYSNTTDDFVSLARFVNQPSGSILSVDIDVFEGDIIGILGTTGTGTMYNSYGQGDFVSSIDGLPVTLTRMGMQHSLGTTPARDLWQESGYFMGRVEMYYTTVCEPPPEPNNPDPCDAAMDVPVDANLSWDVGFTQALTGGLLVSARSLPEREAIAEAVINDLGQNKYSNPTVGLFPLSAFEGSSGATVEILMFTKYSDNSPGGEAENTLNAIADYFTDFNVTTTITTDPVALAAELAGKNLFLVPEQENTSFSTLHSLGLSWQTTLDAFVSGGGGVLLLDHHGGSPATHAILVGAGLMSITPSGGSCIAHGGQGEVVLAHPVTEGVPSVFNLECGTTDYSATDGTAVVVHHTDGRTIISVKEYGDGRIAFFGMDFFQYNQHGARLIANAVQWLSSGVPECPMTWDVYFGTDPCSLELLPECNDICPRNCDPTPQPGETLEECVEYFWQVVAENRCGTTEGPLWSFTTGRRDELPCNRDPNCRDAVPSVTELWPPNHKWVDIEILDVTDPDGDMVSITVTGITQDEPVDGKGSGRTSPDGDGIGTSVADLRAERSPRGNGRIYEISFEADDGMGGICTGSVNVCVPHDQSLSDGGTGRQCIDDGQLYDSTPTELLSADLNKDGIVNQLDFAILTKYWLVSYELDD